MWGHSLLGVGLEIGYPVTDMKALIAPNKAIGLYDLNDRNQSNQC